MHTASAGRTGGEQRGQPEREAEVERDAVGEQLDGRAEREPDRRDARGSRREPTVDQQREHGGRGNRRQRCLELRSDPRSERRSKDGVGGQVMAAIPGVVPEGEAGPGEQVAAVGSRGEVAAGRRGDHIGETKQGRQSGRDRPRRGPLQERAGLVVAHRGHRTGLTEGTEARIYIVGGRARIRCADALDRLDTPGTRAGTAIRDRLREVYGIPRLAPHGDRSPSWC